MNEEPAVSVIIPNLDGRDHLPTCLDSIQRQSLRPREVIVVDDASSDGSAQLLRDSYAWVTLIERESRGGFPAAVNTGLARAGGNFIALLNNDTELDPGWLASMVRALDRHPDAGSVACRMIRFHDRTVLDGAGDFLSRGVSPYTRGFGEPDDGRYRTAEYIFGACAGAALYRKALFESVGPLDEDFIGYYEDVDLALRAQLAGFRCWYEPAAVCYHKRGATGGRSATRLQERNLTGLQLKSLPAWLLALQLPVIVLSRTRRLYRQIRQGAGTDALLGFVQGFGLVPSMIAKRRSVQQRRVVSLRYVRSLLCRTA